MDSKLLLELYRVKMPYGKYKGKWIAELPISYLEWMARKGMPQGKLGMLLSTIYEIKLNGLTELLGPIKELALKSK